MNSAIRSGNSGRGWGSWLPVLLLMLLWAGFPADAAEPLDRLTLVTSSEPGGEELTAQAMKQVLEGEGIVRFVQIEHVAGSGERELSNFIGARRGDGRAVLLGGMPMVGAVVSGHAMHALDELIPLAQLTSDADVIVVPASSPYRTLDDLLEAMRANPEAMRWAGWLVGGSDHPTMWQLARAAGVPPELMRYESFRGGSEVAAQLATGRYSAGIAGYSVFDNFIRSGKLRGLAIVSRQPIDGVSIPTFRQLGIVGVSMTNWSGAFAPPSISEQDQARLLSAVAQMVHSPRWQTALNLLHLRNAYLAAAGFSQLVQEERTRISKAQRASGAMPDLRLLSRLWQHRLGWLLGLGGAIGALLLALCWQKFVAQRREESLGVTLRELSQEVQQRTREALRCTQDMEAVRIGMNAQIEREFDRWGLTPAERSVAHLTLKGMRLKEIAGARNTSDRTVRQQAQAIYRKAGLDGRTDLAAYFLESVLDARELTLRVPETVPASKSSPRVALRPRAQPAASATAVRTRCVPKTHRHLPRRTVVMESNTRATSTA